MYVKVKVQAGAKKEIITKKPKDTYLISVKPPAERNLANKRVCELMASYLGVSIRNVRIISGHQNPNKILSINQPDNLI